MSLDTPSDENSRREEIRQHIAAEGKAAGDSGILKRDQEAQRKKLIFVLEKKEKLLGLKARPLVLDPESPETSPDLIQMERMYTSRLISDEALLTLEAGDTYGFMKLIKKGGMLNRFVPTEKELEMYPRHYESVRTQIVDDLLGTSGKPGTYHVQGFFDDADVMRGYLSYRLPPKSTAFANHKDYGRAMQKYVKYLEKLLELTERDVRRSPSAKTRGGIMDYLDSFPRDKRRGELAGMWEFDTINVDRGWEGAGLLIVRNVLDTIESEFTDGRLQAAFCYRYRGLTSKDEVFGENASSRDFLEGKLGFTVMAHKFDPNEFVIREMSDGECHMYKPEWTYMYCPNDRMRKHFVGHLEESGLVP